MGVLVLKEAKLETSTRGSRFFKVDNARDRHRKGVGFKRR